MNPTTIGRLKKNSEIISEKSDEKFDEIHLTIDELKNFSKSTRKANLSCSSIENRLLEKFNSSKAKINKKRMVRKSLEIEKLKFVPKINPNSTRIILPKYNSEVKLLMASLRKIKPEDEEKLIRPQDVIPKPDIFTIKEVFKCRESPKKQESKPKITQMSLVEKSKYYQEKKAIKAREALIKKNQEIQETCSFQPDLSKTLIKHRKSTQSLTEYFFSNEKLSHNDSVRIPAPNPAVKVEKDKPTEDKGPIITPTYSEISPATRIYGFKEGVNVQKLLSKAKPMIRYNSGNH